VEVRDVLQTDREMYTCLVGECLPEAEEVLEERMRSSVTHLGEVHVKDVLLLQILDQMEICREFSPLLVTLNAVVHLERPVEQFELQFQIGQILRVVAHVLREVGVRTKGLPAEGGLTFNCVSSVDHLSQQPWTSAFV